MSTQGSPRFGLVAASSRSSAFSGGLFVALCLVLLLAACGGGTTSDVDDDPLTPERVELQGRATGGTLVDDLLLAVTVKGKKGLARTASGRRGDGEDANYVADLSALEGPYILSATNGADNRFPDYSVAMSPGVANITPLTTLLTAELLGQPPATYFDALTSTGGFDTTQAAIDAAQRQAVRDLQRELGFEVPEDLGDWVTRPFEPIAGDPMFDTLGKLDKALADSGTDFNALIAKIAEEAQRCIAEQIAVTRSGTTDRFCPLSKRNEPREDDPTVFDVAFTTKAGDALSLQVSGDTILSARYVAAGGASAACTGAGCNGMALGTPAGDGTRTVTFTQSVLPGESGAGAVTLEGTLTTSVPGVSLPPLPSCVANQFFVIHPDRSVNGYCAGPDDFGLGSGGSASASPYGGSRLVYKFNAVSADPLVDQLEVVVQGDTIVSVLVYRFDQTTGAITMPYMCRGDGCSGAVLGPVRIDSSFGIDIQLRDFTLNDVVLRAASADGSLSDVDTVTLRTRGLVGQFFVDPFAPPLAPVAPCKSPTERIGVLLSDGGASFNVCEADMDGQTPQTFFDAGTNTFEFFVVNLRRDQFGNASDGERITMHFDAGGTVVNALLSTLDNLIYRCDGAAGCAGIAVAAPDGTGARRITFAGAVLTEVNTAGIPGDRTATIDGGLTAPPVP